MSGDLVVAKQAAHLAAISRAAPCIILRWAL